MAPCDLCLALSPRFQASRECCQIRLLANMPAHARMAAYARTREVSGRDAEREQRALVTAEYNRQHGTRLERGKAAIQSLRNLIGAVPA